MMSKASILLVALALAGLQATASAQASAERQRPTQIDAIVLQKVYLNLDQNNFLAARENAESLWKSGMKSSYVAYLIGLSRCLQGGKAVPDGIAILQAVPELAEFSKSFGKQVEAQAKAVLRDICKDLPETKDLLIAIPTGPSMSEWAPDTVLVNQKPIVIKWKGAAFPKTATSLESRTK